MFMRESGYFAKVLIERQLRAFDIYIEEHTQMEPEQLDFSMILQTLRNLKQNGRPEGVSIKILDDAEACYGLKTLRQIVGPEPPPEDDEDGIEFWSNMDRLSNLLLRAIVGTNNVPKVLSLGFSSQRSEGMSLRAFSVTNKERDALCNALGNLSALEIDLGQYELPGLSKDHCLLKCLQRMHCIRKLNISGMGSCGMYPNARIDAVFGVFAKHCASTELSDLTNYAMAIQPEDLRLFLLKHGSVTRLTIEEVALSDGDDWVDALD